MNDVSDRTEYTATAKVFHWVVVLFVIGQFAIAWTMPEIKRGVAPVGLIGAHLSLGLLILMTAIARLTWRLTHPAPPPPERLAPSLKLLSRFTHYLLYAILIVLPFLGWANASARGWPIELFGTLPMPQLLPTGSALGMTLGDIHKAVATVFLAAIALHVTGALYYRFILHDRTLQRMTG